MYILLSSEETLYKVTTKPFLAKGSAEQVGAALFFKLKHSLPAKQQQEQSNYINTAAKAAYASLNKLDWTGTFHAEINLTTNTDTPLSFERDSSSVGLGYALALALEWRKQLNKPIDYDVEVFATGEIHSSGSVTAIGHLETKVTAACNFMEAKQKKGALQQAFVVFYPSANEDDITVELQTRVKSLGGQLCPVERLQSALVTLLGGAYDGDAEGRWEPFKGLLSFNYEDSLRFFGRERALAKLSEEFEEAEGLVVVTGVSGSGKSSLIKAGLIPQISHTARDEGKAFDWLVSLPKTHDSIEGILTELLQTLDAHWSSHLASHVAEAFTSPDTFITLVKQAQASQPTKRIFYYIDQYEDVFNHQDISREQAQQLAPVLAQLAKNILKLDIVISIRSEYENMLGQYGSVSHINPELNASEWRDIVYKQATSFGLRYEEGLEKRIVNEASRIQHALPALEYLLEQLYKKAKESDKNARLLTHEQYAQLNGIHGVIAARAEDVIAKHPMQAHAFFEYFVGLNSENNPYAKSVRLDEIQQESPALYQLIHVFIDAQLVIDCSTETEKRVKLAHDTLLNFNNEELSWSTLKAWFEENQDYLKWLNVITGDFKRWKALESQQEDLKSEYKDSPASAFLLNEHDLIVGLGFQQSNSIQQPKVRAYIAQSQQRKEALLKRNAKKQRQRLSIAVFLIVIALVSAAVAWVKQKEATEQEALAIGQRIIAEQNMKKALKSEQVAIEEKNTSNSLAYKARGNEMFLTGDFHKSAKLFLESFKAKGDNSIIPMILNSYSSSVFFKELYSLKKEKRKEKFIRNIYRAGKYIIFKELYYFAIDTASNTVLTVEGEVLERFKGDILDISEDMVLFKDGEELKLLFISKDEVRVVSNAYFKDATFLNNYIYILTGRDSFSRYHIENDEIQDKEHFQISDERIQHVNSISSFGRDKLLIATFIPFEVRRSYLPGSSVYTEEGGFILYDITKNKVIESYPLGRSRISLLRKDNPPEAFLVLGNKLYSSRNSSLIEADLVEHSSQIVSYDFNRELPISASVSENQGLIIYDHSDKKIICEQTTGSLPLKVGFININTLIVLTSSEVKFIDINKCKSLKTFYVHDSHGVNEHYIDMSFIYNENVIYITTLNKVRAWDYNLDKWLAYSSTPNIKDFGVSLELNNMKMELSLDSRGNELIVKEDGTIKRSIKMPFNFEYYKHTPPVFFKDNSETLLIEDSGNKQIYIFDIIKGLFTGRFAGSLDSFYSEIDFSKDKRVAIRKGKNTKVINIYGEILANVTHKDYGNAISHLIEDTTKILIAYKRQLQLYDYKQKKSRLLDMNDDLITLSYDESTGSATYLTRTELGRVNLKNMEKVFHHKIDKTNRDMADLSENGNYFCVQRGISDIQVFNTLNNSEEYKVSKLFSSVHCNISNDGNYLISNNLDSKRDKFAGGTLYHKKYGKLFQTNTEGSHLTLEGNNVYIIFSDSVGRRSNIPISKHLLDKSQKVKSQLGFN